MRCTISLSSRLSSQRWQTRGKAANLYHNAIFKAILTHLMHLAECNILLPNRIASFSGYSSSRV